MHPTTKVNLDDKQEILIKSILFSFVLADYDGGDSLSVNGIVYSDILQHATRKLANDALSVAQNTGLIEWDGERIGAVLLTPLGIKKLHQLRRDFFDDDKNESLKNEISMLSKTIF
jgi:hypothetical protein